MPPAKKQKAAPSAPPSALSPKEDYFARLEAVLKREKCAGSMLVVGLRRDDEDEVHARRSNPRDQHLVSVLYSGTFDPRVSRTARTRRTRSRS